MNIKHYPFTADDRCIAKLCFSGFDIMKRFSKFPKSFLTFKKDSKIEELTSELEEYKKKVKENQQRQSKLNLKVCLAGR